jgi:hypothetical protein
MVTTTDLKNRIITITEELTILTNKIKEPSVSFNPENEIREYENDARKYDTEFEEMKGMQERFGGKTRKQSLQEFVLLFFYVAYALLSTSIIMYSFNFWGALSTLKIFVMLVIFLLGVTGIIIRYG